VARLTVGRGRQGGVDFYALAEGDTLIVTRLDRLARSTRDLLNILATIADKGAGFKSLGDAWADTTTPHGRLMPTVPGGLAEFERELIRARTTERRARAVKNGVRLGRKPNLTPHQIREVIRRREVNGETLIDSPRPTTSTTRQSCESLLSTGQC
jgi:DNA invertase Pin-like site-specific DNA recombinase